MFQEKKMTRTEENLGATPQPFSTSHQRHGEQRAMSGEGKRKAPLGSDEVRAIFCKKGRPAPEAVAGSAAGGAIGASAGTAAEGARPLAGMRVLVVAGGGISSQVPMTLRVRGQVPVQPPRGALFRACPAAGAPLSFQPAGGRSGRACWPTLRADWAPRRVRQCRAALRAQSQRSPRSRRRGSSPSWPLQISTPPCCEAASQASASRQGRPLSETRG